MTVIMSKRKRFVSVLTTNRVKPYYEYINKESLLRE